MLYKNTRIPMLMVVRKEREKKISYKFQKRIYSRYLKHGRMGKHKQTNGWTTKKGRFESCESIIVQVIQQKRFTMFVTLTFDPLTMATIKDSGYQVEAIFALNVYWTLTWWPHLHTRYEQSSYKLWKSSFFNQTRVSMFMPGWPLLKINWRKLLR